MDTSYLVTALQFIRDEDRHVSPYRPSGYQEALVWIIEHIMEHYDDFEEILDKEREQS